MLEHNKKRFYILKLRKRDVRDGGELIKQLVAAVAVFMGDFADAFAEVCPHVLQEFELELDEFQQGIYPPAQLQRAGGAQHVLAHLELVIRLKGGARTAGESTEFSEQCMVDAL